MICRVTLAMLSTLVLLGADENNPFDQRRPVQMALA